MNSKLSSKFSFLAFKYDHEESRDTINSSLSFKKQEMASRNNPSLETEQTKDLTITELKRLVLTEKLQLVRIQIRNELENNEQNINKQCIDYNTPRNILSHVSN